MNQGDYLGNQVLNQQALRGMSPAESISNRIRVIDEELARFSEERRNELWAERARLLKAQQIINGSQKA